MRPHQPRFRMVRRAVAACSLLSLTLGSTLGFAGQPEAMRAVVPPILHGTWQTASECNNPGYGSSVSFRSDAANLGPGRLSNCRLVGLRDLGDTRWYLDFNCADVIVAELDVLQTSPRQLLISSRPLGDACAFTKREQ
jgi:hypothetical protein